MQVEQVGGPIQVGADQKRRYSARVRRPDLHLRRRRELPVQRLACAAQRRHVEPGVGGRRPQPRHPPAQLAAHGPRAGDGLVYVGEHAASAIEQRLAGECQLDVMGGTAEQVGPDQPLQHPDLPAQRGRGQVEAGGGSGEVQLLGDSDERTQVSQLDRLRAAGSGSTVRSSSIARSSPTSRS